jgi:hypothetical protein
LNLLYGASRMCDHAKNIQTTLATTALVTTTFVDENEDHNNLDIDCPSACCPCAGPATSYWRRRAHLSRSVVSYTHSRSLQLHSESHYYAMRLQRAWLRIRSRQLRQSTLLGVLQLASAMQLRHFRCRQPLHWRRNVLAVPG